MSSTDERALTAAVKQLRERRALFDEFCKDKIREQRSKRKDQPKQDVSRLFRMVASTPERCADVRL